MRLPYKWATLAFAATFLSFQSSWAGSPSASDTSDLQPALPRAKPKGHSLTEPIESLGRSILHPPDPYPVVPGKDPGGWSFTMEPYAWALGVSGDIGVKGLPAVDVQASSKKILQNIDWCIMAKAEVRKGRWGIMADGLFAQLSADGTPPGPLYESGYLKFQQGLASIALAYRIIDDRRGFLDIYAGARYNYLGVTVGGNVDSNGVRNVSDAVTERIGNGIQMRMDDILASNPGALQSALVSSVGSALTDKVLVNTADFPRDVRDTVDRKHLLLLMRRLDNNSGRLQELLAAYAQARAAAANNQLTSAIQNRLTSAQKAFSNELAKRIEKALPSSVEGNQWWVDPIVGLRGQINFTRWLFLAAQGDVGGFGAGSQIAWNAQASLGVNFTRNIFGEFGYRYYYLDYTNGGALFNAAEAGVFAGVGVKF
jgi:hypothetical protein